MARTCVIFAVGGLTCALAREEVRRILPLPALARPPGCPPMVEGILNLAGAAVPVVRLDRLFGLPAGTLHAYQHLLLLEGAPALALLVERASAVVTVPAGRLAPVGEGETYNGCVVGQVVVDGVPIPLLSGARLLEERERQALAAFRAMHETRLEGLGPMP